MTVSAGAMATILTAIRKMEGGNYTAHATGSSASGAYQFIDSTWLANGGGQYAARAYLATPAQQDAVAARKVATILAANNDNPTAVPQVWYLGHVASPAELDTVPHPEAGNKLTVRQYVAKWSDAWVVAVKAGGTTVGPLQIPGLVVAETGDQATKVAQKVVGLLGDLVAPFTEGLRRLSIIGLSVLLGVGLVVVGAWRSVRPASG